MKLERFELLGVAGGTLDLSPSDSLLLFFFFFSSLAIGINEKVIMACLPDLCLKAPKCVLSLKHGTLSGYLFS